MKKYNKSEIMKRAHYIYRHSWNTTFSEALKAGWKREKQIVAEREEAQARQASFNKEDKFYGKFRKTISREYRHVTYGRNDWRVSYGRGF